MDDKHITLLAVAIVPQVVDIIIQEEKIDDLEAINSFYQSKTYELLEREDTKLWHYSPLAIYNIWKTEKETGCIELPNEGLIV